MIYKGANEIFMVECLPKRNAHLIIGEPTYKWLTKYFGGAIRVEVLSKREGVVLISRRGKRGVFNRIDYRTGREHYGKFLVVKSEKRGKFIDLTPDLISKYITRYWYADPRMTVSESETVAVEKDPFAKFFGE